MKCPTDSATLVMSERSGIEIDYCPECRGVWLDRGELDKIIERSMAQPAAAPPPPAPVPVGGASFTGGSASGGPNASSGDHDGPSQQQFGVLDPFSFALWQGGGRTWPSREPLTPSSLARPPNDRPG